jgi:hypothetical protein
MKKIIIEITDEQAKRLRDLLSEQSRINFEEETFSGFSINLSCLENGICWLDAEMNKEIELGDVTWKIE